MICDKCELIKETAKNSQVETAGFYLCLDCWHIIGWDYSKLTPQSYCHFCGSFEKEGIWKWQTVYHPIKDHPIIVEDFTLKGAL